MGGILLLGLVALGWAWITGRLQLLILQDWAAALVALLGLRLLVGGQALAAAVLLAGAGVWAARRIAETRGVEPMTAEDARAVLGVGSTATPQEIAQAHRRLIARVHPDRGGSEELASRVNVARDTLIAELSRSPEARG